MEGEMNDRVRIQLAEAMGQVNRWFCSKAHGRAVEEPELLLTYFIKSGGARDFARRYAEAMGGINRWYCSEFYGREVGEPEVLWDYYVRYGEGREVARRVPGCTERLSMA
jgi:hypothetical protein